MVTTYFPILSWEAPNLWASYAVWGFCVSRSLVSLRLSICFISMPDGFEFNQWTTPEQLNKTGLTSAISRRSVGLFWQLFLLLRPPANEQQRETVPSRRSRKCLQWVWAYLITQCMERCLFSNSWWEQIYQINKFRCGQKTTTTTSWPPLTSSLPVSLSTKRSALRQTRCKWNWTNCPTNIPKYVGIRPWHRFNAPLCPYFVGDLLSSIFLFLF